LVGSAGKDAFAVSLWDSEQSTESYSHRPYADLTKVQSQLVQGTPRVKTHGVANSNFHNIAVTLKAA